ncbi:MAG TPA: SGNH/GDSL hydrolase family protein [Pseudolabrys sp.]|nr:SGNH/GDSL hydrolase family protein [Pseudolabrys sp.]
MKILLALLAAWLLMPASAAMADQPGECAVAQPQLEHVFPLPNTQRAIASKQLTVLVLGSGSSTLPGPKGADLAYPMRLQSALRELLPGVTIKVAADIKQHRTAIETVKLLNKTLTDLKPALVVWQTGTVEAMQGIDPDQFSQALDQGINIARSTGADVLLVNAQYSPRTESMIGLSTYAENMRWVALQHEVPLFDRFEIMKFWADLGTFDLTGAANKLDIATRVHNCIGWLLADFATDAAKQSGPQTEGR